MLIREIIVDHFAGGGGASTGIELATGRSVDAAINHDWAAINMHRMNHPDTKHYCESVWDVDPHELFAAQGFPADYIIDVDPDGKPVTKEKQIARCGNSVCPPLAEALVRANLPEMCVERVAA